jgi:hypothetical protein
MSTCIASCDANPQCQAVGYDSSSGNCTQYSSTAQGGGSYSPTVQFAQMSKRAVVQGGSTYTYQVTTVRLIAPHPAHEQLLILQGHVYLVFFEHYLSDHHVRIPSSQGALSLLHADSFSPTTTATSSSFPPTTYVFRGPRKPSRFLLIDVGQLQQLLPLPAASHPPRTSSKVLRSPRVPC